ncbi:MAG: metal ABC transporter solute-binding protein, Zn/Mn family [Cyclonatronaceae bacterium]
MTLLLALTFCGRTDSDRDTRPYVVATTGMVRDAAEQIGGDLFRIDGIMGPGVDPHLYRATPADIRRMEQADLLLYNGLLLEGRLADILDRIGSRSFAVASAVPESLLISAYEGSYGGTYDPHIWFDVSLWKYAVDGIAGQLIELAPEHEDAIRVRNSAYHQELDELHRYVTEQIGLIPEERRVLITAHDAFGYFGRAYGMQVEGLQGISTASEYGLRDVKLMRDLIIGRRIPAIFIETSLSSKSIESLIAGTRESGWEVSIGGQLYSDALGEQGTDTGTYTGMFRHNTDQITQALR